MPASQVSLQHLFALASEKKLDLGVFMQDLLRRLRGHHIRAICGEYIKSNLALLYEHRRIEEILCRLLFPVAEKDDVLKQAREGKTTIHVWANDNYYTFVHRSGMWEVYSDGDYRQKSPGQEINPSWYPFAWLDDDRYALLCEDLENRSRFVFEKVSFDRRDIAAIFQEFASNPSKPRGVKPRFVDHLIVNRAKLLLSRQPDIRRNKFEEAVREWLGPDRQPGPTQFRKLYGYLWTEHNRALKSVVI